MIVLPFDNKKSIMLEIDKNGILWPIRKLQAS
jgi:hypothetical protein